MEAGNLENSKWGYWFIKGLLFKYRRYAMAKTGADPDRRSLFNFYYFKEVVKNRVSANKGAN